MTTPLREPRSCFVLNRGTDENSTIEVLATKWDIIKPLIKPLDVMLFNGNEFISKTIAGLEKKVYKTDINWSHVGIVVNRRVMPNIAVKDDDTDKLYLWESTVSSWQNDVYSDHILDIETGDLWESTVSSWQNDVYNDHILDIETGEPFCGVQVRDLEMVVKNDLDNGVGVAWCQLIKNPLDREIAEPIEIYEERVTTITQKLTKLHETYNHRCYELNVFRLLGALWPSYLWLRSKFSIGKNWIFCSELVAIIYKDIGIFPSKTDETIVTPDEIADSEISTYQKLPIVLHKFENII